MTAPDYRSILRAELTRRTEANNSYSMRAFARSMELDAASLSRVLARKKGLSSSVAIKVAARLGLAPVEREAFLSSVEAERLGARASQLLPGIAPRPPVDLDMETFRVIADLHHYAILELSLTVGFKSDYRWIAKALKITPVAAKLAVERLLALGLLQKTDKGFRKTDRNVNTANKDKTSAAHRSHQAQILEKAQASLENDPVAERSMSGMTMAINPDQLPEARKLIQEFMRGLCNILESGEQRQVYQLGINFFPLQRKDTTYG